MARRASRTAVGVARGVAFAARDPVLGRILPPRAAALTEDLLRAYSKSRGLELTLMGSAPYRWLARWHETHGIRGAFTHIALRKRFVDDAARAALRRGASQLVVLGGGFDTLALRLATEQPRLRAFEVDHPESQRHKRDALHVLGCAPANLHLIATDVDRGRLVAALRAHPEYDPGAFTLFVAEGLLMYLDAEGVDGLFEATGELAPRRRIVFTHVGVRDDGRPRVGRGRRWLEISLRLAGEPFRFGLNPPDVPGFLAHRGLLRVEQVDDFALARRYLGGAGASRDAPRASPAQGAPRVPGFLDPDGAFRPLLDWEYLAVADADPARADAPPSRGASGSR